MSCNKKVVIIGGGIIGLSSAYYLHKAGHEVVVVDKNEHPEGASYINAGMITPSHIVPLAAPGMIAKGLSWMFNAESPLYIKPRWDPDFFRWALAFKRSATAKHVARSIPIIKDINLLSKELYEAIKISSDFNFQYTAKGLLMLCASEKALEEEWAVGKIAIEEGLAVKKLSIPELQQLEPHARLRVKGAVHYKSDAHMTPSDFMSQIKKFLATQGVTFHLGNPITEVKTSEGKIKSISTAEQQFTADRFVLAAGIWSANLAKKLGVTLALQAGKGYALDVNTPTGIETPSILVEAKVAVTPMTGVTRFAGTMELGGINNTIYPKRVAAIARAAENYYDGLTISEETKSNAQCGLRPCSPDGLPYIGFSEKCSNLLFATGHAMMGWSLGPATGKLIAELVSEQKTSLDIKAFHPDRRL